MMLLILLLILVQNNIFALNSIRTVEGRISNLHDPVDSQDAATKNYVDNKIEGIQNPPVVLQTEGKSKTAVMSQKATTDLVNTTKDNLDDIVSSFNKKIEELKEKQPIISSGTWDPIIISDDTYPTYTTFYKYGKYYRINNLVYITFYMKINITNCGSGYAQIGGLPFVSGTDTGGQGLALHEFIINTDSVDNPSGYVIDNTNKIQLLQRSGLMGRKWENGDCWVGFSGSYITNEPINDLSNISINQNIFNAIYPVGSIYMSVNSVNPSVLFGGIWESWCQGRVPMGVGSNGTTNYTTAETKGGSSEHRHDWRIGTHWWYGGMCGENVGNGTGAYVYSENRYDGWGRELSTKSAPVNTAIYNNQSAVTANPEGKYSQGNTSATSTLQPYITCYMWKRTA